MSNKLTRKKKTGFIYLLESRDGILLKFGCSINPKQRIRHLNYQYKNNPFSCFALFESDDIFDDECKIKWILWNRHIAGSETFICSNNIDKNKLFELAKYYFCTGTVV